METETNHPEEKNSWIKRSWWLALLLAAAIIAPFVLSEFYLTILGEALIMSLLALSFNLLFGFMGQLSFGQAAFYGLSGYTVAMLITKFHFNFWLSLAAGVLVAAVLGLIIGFFCVRLRGIYFSILTLAFGQLIYFVIYKWHDFTGGDDGIQGVYPPDMLNSPVSYYFFILIVFILATYLLWRIVNSPFGYTLKSMRENSERTEFLGISIARYQLVAFIIAAAYAGLAGALWAPFYRSMAPSFVLAEVGGTRQCGHFGRIHSFLWTHFWNVHHDLLSCLGSGLHRFLGIYHGGSNSYRHLLPPRWDARVCCREA